MPPHLQYRSIDSIELNNLLLREGKGGLVQERERERREEKRESRVLVLISVGKRVVDWIRRCFLTLLRGLFCFEFGFFSLPLGGFGLR